MPSPPMKRATTNWSSVAGIAAPIDEAANSSAAAPITSRRPKRSLSHPAPAAPTAQPNSRLPAANSICALLRWNSARSRMIAPLMTAMSKPNSNPEIAAAADTA